ncbi:ATP-binding cassette domain-containing protein [Pseudidiomarina terrestris]|uniref:ATP-binding cassette domain-containing protein n=1 Tax=Pseudidiomarina terrestris TaxID=2820060 RepID=A0ABT8MHI9_9GAMM|nr:MULTISPECIES: ATP-binding cassette domain-containing protein [unclassified Pseudidiomarina]MDN7126302.1 ATP-binding cassette domain-containing protein [Pseudidiomarina sp. 1APR75-33.1]MDN7129408.1 ATP-binding cassette domain-containing protein [Pseudidiomarina sp. 1APR75-15]MDN7134327.1 ATP-binding cassette domain-containing protein [Pseudidiomarina sp. 1ASP75-5]MDN7136985.1 ATP-binding cassette domain-containing protein [Pseudidiomarina sp. 1ASP75-14]
MTSADADDLVVIENLDFAHGYGAHQVYKGLEMRIPRGKITAVMGPSGIGKTTLLRLIGGQLKPQSGSIKFAGHDIPQLSRSALYEQRKRMSMLFQSGALFTDMTVFDNIAFPIREHSDLPDEIIETIVLMKLEAVGLRGARDLMPGELSGGMARRAALARAIALDPELIMYDEPFAGQDPISMGVIVKLIKSLNNSLGLTSVVVTHDVAEVLTIADKVFIIADKKVVAEGTPEELKASDDDLVQQFLSGDADGPVPFHYKAESFAKDILGEEADADSDAEQRKERDNA